MITLALRYAPDQPVYNADGTYTFGNTVGDPVDNPFAVATERIDETKTDNFRANLYANYEIIEGLSFKSTFGLSTENQTRGIYLPSLLTQTAGGESGRAIVNTDRSYYALDDPCRKVGWERVKRNTELYTTSMY